MTATFFDRQEVSSFMNGGESKNQTERRRPITCNRIVDGQNNQLRTLSEVKNVQNLSYTRQLRDYADAANNLGYRFDLYVRPGTNLWSASAGDPEGFDQPPPYSMKKKKITAAEWMAELNADPVYLAMRAAQEQARAKVIAEEHQAQAPLIAELRSAGLELDSVFDLVNRSAQYPLSRYPSALPVLLEHLQRPYPANIRAGIASALALAVPEAKFAWDWLVQLYRNEREEWPKSRLAVALAATLLELQNDEDLKKEIKTILRRMKKAGVEHVSSGTSGQAITNSAEASMNFDADMVESFLERLSALIEGFGPVEISRLLRAVNELEVDNECTLAFRVTRNGQPIQLNIQVFKDDVDSVDLYFFAPGELVEEIDKLMDVFCAEHVI